MSGRSIMIAAREQSLTPNPITPGVRIGHVDLKVSDLSRALAFYCGVLGFRLTQRFGDQATVVSAGAITTPSDTTRGKAAAVRRRTPGTTGLYHAAILYSRRAALADALKRLMQADISLDVASDHGISEALYLRDPDENGLELYWAGIRVAAHSGRPPCHVYAPP
jgi:catechol 2,3-dioxygenase